jgi:hypothetical protein
MVQFTSRSALSLGIKLYLLARAQSPANVQDRAFYVEGVGQLCKNCWETTYCVKGKTDDLFLSP